MARTVNIVIRKTGRVVVPEEVAQAWLDWVTDQTGTVNVEVRGTVLVYEDGTVPPA